MWILSRNSQSWAGINQQDPNGGLYITYPQGEDDWGILGYKEESLGTLGKSTKGDKIPAITETRESVLNYPNQLVIDFEEAGNSYINWR